ncbi:MAG: hypothetical protein MUC29_04200 [Pyrinomonadaceae bacterium]|jgi:hypothetical protein|nr:hypothetical protein [Pyrinomonadaceae bacterium]
MTERRGQGNYYVTAIIKDIQNQFVREETKSFSEDKIVREYEFEDGAIIKYEWQTAESSRHGEPFNHRFTLIKAPIENEDNLQLGVIKIMNY